MADEPIELLLKKFEGVPSFAGRSLIQIDTRTIFGDTPLHLAAEWGDVHLIKALLEAGADLNASGDAGYTPLHYAVAFRKPAAAKHLVSCGADVSIRSEFGTTATEDVIQDEHTLEEYGFTGEQPYTP